MLDAHYLTQLFNMYIIPTRNSYETWWLWSLPASFSKTHMNFIQWQRICEKNVLLSFIFTYGHHLRRNTHKEQKVIHTKLWILTCHTDLVNMYMLNGSYSFHLLGDSTVNDESWKPDEQNSDNAAEQSHSYGSSKMPTELVVDIANFYPTHMTVSL